MYLFLTQELRLHSSESSNEMHKAFSAFYSIKISDASKFWMLPVEVTELEFIQKSTTENFSEDSVII